MRATLTLAALGILVAALTWAAIATAHATAAELPRHLLLYIGAGAAWSASLAIVPRLARAPEQLVIVFIVAVALRAPAWAAEPAHSDDVYRYVWDARVARAGVNPYRWAPDAPELAHLRDGNWARINNRELPTIYPPAAQLAFRLASSLPVAPLAGWKLLVAAFDLATLALVAWWLARRGGDARLAIAWGWSPLVALELGMNLHLDGLGIALLTAALVASERGRRAWAGALLGAATAVKLVGLAILPGLRSRRAALAFAAVLVLAAAPFWSAGARLRGSLGEYGRRWRSNDGAFAVLHAGAEAVVTHSRFAARHELAGWPRVARAITGRDRDQVFPDEAANLLARLAAFALFAAAVAAALRARLRPTRFAAVALGAFLLLAPALHPWYVLWMLPLVAAGASPAWWALAALAPLGYWPLGEFRAGAGWHDPLWTRALEHGLTWALLAAGWWRARSALTGRDPPVISETS
ncbi:MAG TPA: glycosyltransferase 87 family protein [Polyangia bacterium]|nr:glycosyltransferase 87 family protein [Polyangia bacterium]